MSATSAGLAWLATGHPDVSAAGAEMLAAGGNVFDAVVAAALATSAAEPGLTSLGGGGFLLAVRPGQPPVLVDFFVDVPGRGRPATGPPPMTPVTLRFAGTEQHFHAGPASVAVPGVVAGLLHVQRRFGRLPLEAVVAPAARLAREGAPVSATQAYCLELSAPVHVLGEGTRRLYLPGGRAPAEGELLVNPELADFLEALPRGADRDLYAGALGAALVAAVQAGGGALTQDDLLAYRVVERAPLRQPYRDTLLLTNPPPAFGGAAVATGLRLHGEQPLAPLGHGSAAHLLRQVEVMQAVERLRPWTGAGGTTHLSLIDGEGAAASLSLSNGEGAGMLLPGTGVQLNNMLGEDDLHPEGPEALRPGTRVASGMAPSIVMRGGRPVLVLGSGGSRRIRTALVSVLCAVVDFGLPVDRAVAAPRLHWDGERVQAEPGFDPAALDALERHWPVHRWTVGDLYFGGVHAVDPRTGGAGDPRRGGHALAVPGAPGG